MHRIMNRTVALPLAFSVLLVAAAFHAVCAQEQPAPDQPYSGFREREIEALAPDEVQGLLAGEGLGLALAAD